MGLKFQNLSFNPKQNSILEQAKVLNLKEKVKPGFLLSFMCMFPESNETKFWSHSLLLQDLGILQIRMDKSRDPMTMNFGNFQIQKWIPGS